MDAHSRASARFTALLLVAASAVGGVIACAIGALQWGFLGLSVGLAGAWGFFLLGLFGLYRREQRRQYAEDRDTTAEVADVPAHAPAPLGSTPQH